jgi:hypothetical protein
MSPPNPSLRRSQPFNRAAFAVIGMPARSLNAGITEATPAATAAVNGGRYTSRRVRSEMSTEA